MIPLLGYRHDAKSGDGNGIWMVSTASFPPAGQAALGRGSPGLVFKVSDVVPDKRCESGYKL